MRLGAHMSIEGGLDRAVDRAKQAGCRAFQIFTKNSNQWKARELGRDEIELFRRRVEEEGLGPVSAHDSYLINLASPDEVLYRRSVEALLDEVGRCESLGIPYLIVHPGAHVGSGVGAGIARIAAGLNEVLAGSPDGGTRILLETWAGQGTTIGSRFEEIAEILSRVRAPERVGVCFDTCHVFAAGYDIREASGYEETIEALDRIIGLERVRAFHLNDSRTDLGSRVDRHEHIGKGWIGLEAFRLLLNDSRFESVPMYLETPKGPELLEDMENLRTLRSLVGDAGPRAWAPPPSRPAGTARVRVRSGGGRKGTSRVAAEDGEGR